MIRTLLFSLVGIIIFSSTASAQIKVANIEAFNIKSGLSQNAGNYIMQDSKGYIWIGTQDGLNKFDGYRFKVYKRRLSKNNTLSDNLIHSMCAEGDSALWIATQRGLSRYRYATDDFESFLHDPNDAFSIHSNSVYYVFIDSEGVLWAKTERGLDKYNAANKEFIYYKHPFHEFSFTSPYNIFTIREDSEGNIWTGTKDGLAKFNKKSEQFSIYKPSENYYDDDNEVFSIFISDENIFFVGTKSGLFQFFPETGNFKSLFEELSNQTVSAIFQDSKGTYWFGTQTNLYSTEKGSRTLRNYNEEASEKLGYLSRVTAITEDKSQILWISAESGIFKIDLKDRKFKLYRNIGNGSPDFSSNRIFSIYGIDNDRILLGTRKHGLNYFNRKTNEVKVINSSNSDLSDNNIHIIRKDRKDNILLGTENGIYAYDIDNKMVKSFISDKQKNFGFRFKNNRIADILHDSKNRYWVATFNGLFLYTKDSLQIYTASNPKHRYIGGNEVLSIIERKNGEIWAATNNGLSRYNESENTFETYNEETHGLSHFSALYITETADGTLWAGTEFGLNKFVEEKNTFKVYSSDNAGFANDFIYCILEDNNQNLWLSTNKGLIKFNTHTEKAINFHVEDGLQSYEFNIGAAFKSPNGEMFFGGVEGFNSFFPDSIKVNEYAPPIIITDFEVLSSEGVKRKIIHNKKNVKLAYDERTFTIYFSMPEYTHLNKNTYECIIEGFNNWQDLGTNNFYSVTQIPPGEYKMLIRAYNSDKVEAEEMAELYIFVPAPWWMRTWAYFMYAILTLTLLTMSFLVYNKQVRRENKILIEKQKTAKKIEQQKELLSIKNKNISDSILYAKRIIEAMMPSEKFIKKILPDSFILFMPKDIVSGDFYWADYRDGTIYVAAVDCTGHGVPGAFMSIVGLNLLRDILSLGIENPASILDRMSKEVKEIFESDDENADRVRDGMDITICAINPKQKQLQFAGAKNPLYLIRNDQIVEYKGDRFSVGPGSDDSERFKNHSIQLQEDDIIYMFSDGYADQFGGPQNKKFKYRRFRSVLLDIHKKETEIQKTILKETIIRWKSSTEQIDDILIMGIRPLNITLNIYD